MLIIVHLLQVSGEAKYTGDVPLPPDALHAAIVQSSQAHAKLLSIDATEALAMPGVVGFYSAKDVPGSHEIGPAFPDEECFAIKEVTCVGQAVGVIVADTHEQAMRAATAVKVRRRIYLIHENSITLTSLPGPCAANRCVYKYASSTCALLMQRHTVSVAVSQAATHIMCRQDIAFIVPVLLTQDSGLLR